MTEAAALNGICPYFTMFPLEFPLGILRRQARRGESVLDPFCGRGTTNFAARLAGLHTVGVDSSPVAAAIAAAKLVSTTAESVSYETEGILRSGSTQQIPVGEFWAWAFDPDVLEALCRMREALLEDCSGAERIALRAIVLGALHGPQQKSFPSYFSNQCPRTYAPKPAYAVRYWKNLKLTPRPVDVVALIHRRAARYYVDLPPGHGVVRHADGRNPDALRHVSPRKRFDWIITSPPYYGMRTYVPDQWLRNWFVGGPNTVDYSTRHQVVHSSPDEFAADLRRVWRNAYVASSNGAKLIVRFGGISDRNVEPLDLLRCSLADSGWRIRTARTAGTAREGKRQADAFLRRRTKPVAEYDVWAAKD